MDEVFERVDLRRSVFRDADLRVPVAGAGWPPPESFAVRECLLIVLNEEWQHRLYAERDLDLLDA